MTLVCADAWEWMKEQPDKSVDAIITDYVYGSPFNIEECKRICRGNIMTFCAAEDHPFDPTERAYWIKTPSTKNYSKHIGRFVEMVFILRQGNTFNSGLHWSQYTGVYTDLVEEQATHQWQKPKSLIERLIRIYTNSNDLVLDPFCGSGTTLSGCKNLGRKFIGIDIDKKWIDYCQKYESTK